MHLDTLVLRLLGPFLFSCAFVLFIDNYNTIDTYMNTVKGMLTDNSVYEESEPRSNEGENFNFGTDGCYSVSGTYLMSVLSGDLTEKVIVESNDMPYKRLVIDSSLVNFGSCYTLYKQKLQPNGVNSLTPVITGRWIAGESLDLSKIVDPSASYLVESEYASTGALISVTYRQE